MYKFKIGTEVAGQSNFYGHLDTIGEGKIVKRKKWSGENWYTLDDGNTFLEDEIKEVKDE
tara:strand:+ start:434 stop:613 length:180 start_codon:yes stop_codon:yes gene_type:complete